MLTNMGMNDPNSCDVDDEGGVGGIIAALENTPVRLSQRFSVLVEVDKQIRVMRNANKSHASSSRCDDRVRE